MYKYSRRICALSPRAFVCSALVLALAACEARLAPAQEANFTASAEFATPNIIRKISRESERLEMTANSSRILTLDSAIPRVQVNNPELVVVTPLSATQIQISAKKPGVTQVNLWDADNKVHTVDVIIYGDVRELEVALKTQFPNSTIQVKKFTNSLMLTGFVDRSDHVSPIVRLAEDYAPKVINNLDVGGVQQVLLKVKIFEVSRTKLRQLGVDFAIFGDGGDFAISSVSGLINSFDSAGSAITSTGDTFSFGLVDGGTSFFGVIDALQQNNIAKILAEPNLVSVSGRPAQFLQGGETPVLIPQGNSTVSIEYKPFGTQVDFLPIVLGNGNIRLEVRPRVSDLDFSLGVTTGDTQIPGFRVRHADTAVEMKAGQTFALAGLIQQRTDSVHTGIPFLSDIPVIGVPFRRVREQVNEVELLFLVTPELIDALDPCEVPPCGPGQGSMSPDNATLYFGGHIEVPNAYGPCGPGVEGCNGGGCDSCGEGYGPTEFGPTPAGPYPYDQAPLNQDGMERITPGDRQEGGLQQGEPTHGELDMPSSDTGSARLPSLGASSYRQAQRPGAYSRATPATPPPGGAGNAGQGGMIGPVGYDVP